MNSELILNPFLQVYHGTENVTDFLLSAPKKGHGLKTLEIKQTDNKHLHGLVSELFEIGFSYLDPQGDLSKSEIELFKEFGILIEESQKPELPVFSCQLDEIEVKDEFLNHSDLIVNPTIRFEPFDLTNFKTWIPEKHISPHQPTIWVKQKLTEIEIGFWLNQDQAAIVSNLKKGEKIPSNIDRESLAKFISAGIFVTQNGLENEKKKLEKKIEKARENFLKKKYVVFDQIYPKSQIRAMQKFYKEYIAQGFMQFGDNQVAGRFRQHNEPLAKFFHHNLTKLMSLITGEEVRASYCYAASYIGGGELRPHTDREQCEFSVSFQVDYSPPQKNEVSPWELYLATPKSTFEQKDLFGWDEFFNDPNLSGCITSVNLANGDGLFYKGRDLIHYRFPISENHTSTSIFFHYVPKDFEGSLL